MQDLKIIRAEHGTQTEDSPVESIRMVLNTGRPYDDNGHGQIIWVNASWRVHLGGWTVDVIDTSRRISIRVGVDLLDCFGNELPRTRPSDGLVPPVSVFDNLNKELIAEVMSRYDHGQYEESMEHPIQSNWQWHSQVTNVEYAA